MFEGLATTLGLSVGVGAALIYCFRRLTSHYEESGYQRAILEMQGLDMEAIRKAAAAVRALEPVSDGVLASDPDNRDKP